MDTRAPLREYVEILGIFSMFALSVFAYLVWWIAFLEGGRIWLDIRLVGEMWLEYAVWLIVTPLITLAMYYYLSGGAHSRSR